MISVPQGAERSANPSTRLATSLSLGSQAKRPSIHAPSDAILLNAMKSAYLEYRLLNGTMSRYIEDRKRLVDALEKFWSVWLWRWDVQKSGCGGVDFDQLLGCESACIWHWNAICSFDYELMRVSTPIALQLPRLFPQHIPKRLAGSMNTLINKSCLDADAIPILLHHKKVVHLPQPEGGHVMQQDINSLTRYLLTLMGGSEARNVSTEDAQHDPISSVFSNFPMRSISGTPLETSMKSFVEPSQWAHRAFSWASNSFPSPHISGPDDVGQSVESLDEQLRAEMGLPSLSPVRLTVSRKSTLSHAMVAGNAAVDQTQVTPIGTRRTSSLAVDYQGSSYLVSLHHLDLAVMHCYSMLNVVYLV